VTKKGWNLRLQGRNRKRGRGGKRPIRTFAETAWVETEKKKKKKKKENGKGQKAIPSMGELHKKNAQCVGLRKVGLGKWEMSGKGESSGKQCRQVRTLQRWKKNGQ